MTVKTTSDTAERNQILRKLILENEEFYHQTSCDRCDDFREYLQDTPARFKDWSPEHKRSLKKYDCESCKSTIMPGTYDMFSRLAYCDTFDRVRVDHDGRPQDPAGIPVIGLLGATKQEYQATSIYLSEDKDPTQRIFPYRRRFRGRKVIHIPNRQSYVELLERNKLDLLVVADPRKFALRTLSRDNLKASRNEQMLRRGVIGQKTRYEATTYHFEVTRHTRPDVLFDEDSLNTLLGQYDKRVDESVDKGEFELIDYLFRLSQKTQAIKGLNLEDVIILIADTDHGPVFNDHIMGLIEHDIRHSASNVDFSSTMQRMKDSRRISRSVLFASGVSFKRKKAKKD